MVVCERSMARLRSRGKLPIRERISAVIDRDSPFYEISPLAANCSDYAVGGGLVMGIGVIEGTECMIMGNDPTVLGGALTAFAGKKIMRAIQIARENRLPYVQFVESAGGDLRGSDDPERQMREQLDHFGESGRLFYDVTELSKLGIASIAVVFGSSTAGGAYQPGMSDYNIFIKERSKVFLGGPPLVQMATGEISDDETLGGAQMHAETSGLADYLAEDELDALRMCREVVAHLNHQKRGYGATGAGDAPIHDPEELLGLISRDLAAAVDVREVIARTTDGSRFEEFKARYGTTLICGWGHVHGYAVGILGNNGPLFSESANKAAQFIQLCNQRDIPLLFLHNITGLHGGQGLRARWHREEWQSHDQCGVELDGAPHQRDLGIELWGRQLWHVWPRVQHSIHLSVAHSQDCDHGPQTNRWCHVARATRPSCTQGHRVR